MPEKMTCRGCGAMLTARNDALIGKRAYRYADLAFACDACQRGYSNSWLASARVEITPSPAANVPPEVATDLDAVLSAACNRKARAGKRWKFCSARSEDAASWTVIQALRSTGQLRRVAEALGLSTTGGTHVLLWGAPLPPDDPGAVELAESLADVSDELGENPDRRSEPDIIIGWDNALVILEAKLGSSNDRQAARLDRFDRYLVDGLWAASAADIKAEGLYELSRNWTIGCKLAERTGRTTFVLGNLAPLSRSVDVAAFGKLCATTASRRVVHVRWRDVLPDPPPVWLVPYIGSRSLDAL
jgi:hypothetical protein